MQRIFLGLVVITSVIGGYLVWNYQSSDEQQVRKVHTYVALGDSYTIGTGVKVTERWPNQLVARLKQEGMDLRLVANPATTGFTTNDILRTQLDELEKYQPDFVTVMVGVNDLAQRKSPDDFQRDYQTLLNEIQNTVPHAKILVFTLPNYSLTPFGKRTTNQAEITKAVHDYNAVIRRVSSANDIRIVDIYPISLLVSEDVELVTYDGLHPSGRQYEMWVDVATPATMVLLREH